MSKELKVMEPKQYDDEIDLYELIEILVRHKWSIVITTVLCTLLSLGAALYMRSKTPNYLIKNILIQQDTYGLKGVNRIDIDSVLLQDKNIKKILDIQPIKKEYLEKTPENLRNITSERKFLQDILTISKNDKNPNEISIKAEIVADENGSKEIINRYLDILREQDNLSDVITEEKNIKVISLQKTRIELEKIQNEILDIFKKDSDLRALKPEEKVNYITYKYPELNLKRSEQEKYYNTYVNELVRLDSLNNNLDVIKETTDIYFVKGQSKAKLILAVGIVMGVFLGIMVAFLKDFIDGYKRRFKK
ncbi:Wzz/FepE/Etk N-terminal domain-containing protein [uncultured Cetobacterium sp.]|uniref:Wzz/FepE/Etk N-terminal domain-containing protein n=1 Tax=uncultured Cetobacterium sp. TaxID=527638 RepID=UPI0026155A01|nr:Wzz/FepE/Etk N-terminal domain-containing protein [uncultured Cetobacterium sp.]